MYQIHVVEKPTQRRIRIDLEGDQTVKDLKDRIQEILGVPPDQMALGYKGILLSEGQTVDSLNSQSKTERFLGWVWQKAGIQLESEQEQFDSLILEDVEISYLLDGGCAEHGVICCECCSMTGVIRPLECIDRCFCFFVGCDCADANSIQCWCWRCYCCMRTEQKHRVAPDSEHHK